MRKLYPATIVRFFLLFFITTSFFFSIQLQAQTPTYFKGSGTSQNNIPLNSTGMHCQQIYTPADFNSLPISGLITKIYFRNTAAAATGTFANFSVAFQQNSLTAFPNSTFLTGFTTALTSPSYTLTGNATAGGWFEIPLATPFVYDNSQTLVVEIKYTSKTGGISVLNTTSVGSKRLSIPSAPGAATGNLSTTWADFGIDITPTTPCTTPPNPGTAITAPSVICAGTPVTLNLNGNSIGAGQTYQWQSSSNIGGPFVDFGTSSSFASLVTSPTVSAFYRAAVTCGGNTQYSTPVEVTVNPPLPGGNYTINPGFPSGGGNFQTIAEAINAMNCGIAGPVVFDVAIGSGPYNEQVIIPAVNGASATNTITLNGHGAFIQATPVTGARHLIRLDGADYVTIKNFNISALSGSAYGWGVHLTNGADHNTIDSCTIDMSAVTSTTASNSGGIIMSGSPTSITTAGNANYNTISNNTIIGGYQGIVIIGAATSLNAVQNVITKNEIRDFLVNGISLDDNNGATISYNNIHRTFRTDIGTTASAGIELTAGSVGCLINANSIHDTHNSATTQSGTFYGIILDDADGTAGAENKITNNLIYNINSASGTQYGIYNTGANGAHYYHNTIVLDHAASTAGTTRGFYQTGASSNIIFKNNIVYITRGGTGAKNCLYFGTTTSSIISNKNVLYMGSTTGTVGIGNYNSVNFATLADWQNANTSAYDQQSLSLDPLFVNPGGGDFTPAATTINDKGDNVGIATDILGATRNLTAPDPGAFEFDLGGCINPPTPGTAISSVTNACVGEVFTLELTGNSIGSGQTYQWQSSPDNSTWTNIGVPATIAGLDQTQTATSWYRAAVKCKAGSIVYSPSVQVISPLPVSGTFTINNAVATGGSNFASFGDAVNHIKCGIDGPVVFNVAANSGPYNEQVIIPAIAGTSAINTITFNGNGAVLNFLSTQTTERAVLKLDGTDYVTIDSLQIKADGSLATEFGYGIQLVNNADYNTITRCTVTATKTPATAASSAFAGIVINSATATTPIAAGASLCDSNTISRNTIIGGYAGITMVANSATSTISGNKVIGNVIQDFYIYGVYIEGNKGTLIEDNDVSRPTRTTVGNFNGVYMSDSSLNTRISKNRFHNPFDGNLASTSGAYGVNCNAADASAGNETIISNNIVYNYNGNGVQNGFLNTGSSFVHYYYNSISLDDAAVTVTDADTRGFYQTTVAEGLVYKNNIVKITRAGTLDKECIYFNTATTTFVSDYNNFYNTTTGSIGRVNATTYSTLSSWQTATTGDAHSLSLDPLFVSSSDLHLQAGSPLDDKATPLTNVTIDFDNEDRHPVAPTMGADELLATSGIDMQASELVTPVGGSSCYGNELITIRVKNNSVTPIDFSVVPVTVNVTVTGVVSANFSAVISSGTLAAGATLDVPMANPASTIDMILPGNYVFNASTTAIGDLNPANNAMQPFTRTRLALKAGTITATPLSFCTVGGTPTLTASGYEGHSGLQWQQSTSSGSGFSDVPGATSNTYTPATAITQAMFYRVVASCHAAQDISPEQVVLLNNPQLLTSTDATTCGTGSVLLSATGSAGTTLAWYENSTGGVPLGTGSTFATPAISNTTTYYVSAAVGEARQSYHVGYVNSANYSFITQSAGWGLMFTAHMSCSIDSVYVYPTGTGTVSIRILDPSNNVVYTGPVVNITGTGSEKVGVYVGANLVAGNYKMGMASTGVSNLGSQPTGTTMAYPFVSVPLTITSGSQGTGAVAAVYYWFYDWVVSTGAPCASPRVPVVATVLPGPTATINYANSPYCVNGGTATVTHTGNTGGVYSSTIGLSINPTTGAINLNASTAGNYIVTYTLPASGNCGVFTTTTSINITAAPTAVIAYSSPLCINSGMASVTQTGTGGGVYSATPGLSIDAVTGAINTSASAAGSYTVTYTVAAANGCSVFTTTAPVSIVTGSTWVGVTNSNWNTASNWCGGIPTSTSDVTIPATVPNMPNLSAGTGSVRNLVISNGATVTIGAGGTLELYGNISGAGAFNATAGSINFRSTTPQTIPGFTATNVTMNGAGGVTPAGNTVVTGSLTLTNGNITLGSNNLTLNNSSTGSASSHIITNGTGHVIASNLAAAQTRTIPVGANVLSYNPATITGNTGHTTDNITVRVQQGVFENGVSGATYSTHVADRMWIINEGTSGGSNVNVMLQWTGSQELTSFVRGKSYVMQHNGTTWVTAPSTPAAGNDPYTQVKNNVTSFSPFAVQTQPIPRPLTGLYPNPVTSGYLNVVTDLSQASTVKFTIYDIKGALVYTNETGLPVGLSQTRLELDKLPSGVYVLRVSTNLNIDFMVERFVKVN